MASNTFTTQRILLLLAAFLLLVQTVHSLPGKHNDDDDDDDNNSKSGTRFVRNGQSIQQAINAARRGDRIIIEAGTYAENLLIKTDGLRLIGRKGAKIVPPAVYVNNECTGLAGNLSEPLDPTLPTQAGICIIGTGVSLEAFVTEHKKVRSVGRPIRDVSVSGLELGGYFGLNVAVVGGRDISVSRNKLLDGTSYGLLTTGSRNTVAEGNIVGASVEGYLLGIALCQDDKTSAEFSDNTISNYFIGLCVQTAGARIRNNKVSNSCVGAFVDPGIKGAVVEDNKIKNRNPLCPELFGAGILIAGGINTKVQNNYIEGIKFNATTNYPGIFLTDDFILGTGLVPTGNVIRKNVLRNNDIDILINTNGTNVVRDNRCVGKVCPTLV